MFRFENLEIWKLSIAYGKKCYKIAATLPKEEVYALGSQLRRAALSISNNIAEGSVGSEQNFKKYLTTAIGSTLETVNILHFALEVGYIDIEIRGEMYEEAEKLIRKTRSFMKSLDL
ncbi:four helix bundle protein [Candidatus Uhrbacteria bacterium]|nr:four helix bundle protein [Candidatus Uhrbacteria bacterium]